MKSKELIQKVKALNLPKNSYIVFGSGPLVAHRIRESGDIDLFVSEEVYKKLKEDGWKETIHGTDKSVLVNGVYEVGKDWKFGSHNPALKDLLKTAEFLKGVPIANLGEFILWKQAYNREKDRKDIELAEKYLRGKTV